MSSTAPFIFICGPDDFLVNRRAQTRFAALTKGIEDDLSREILSGLANNQDEVASAIGRLRESIQTIPLFGGRRAIWFKDVNFLADSVTGRADGTLKLLEELQAVLERINPAEVSLLITAAPVDRRRAFLKWCEKTADYEAIGFDDKSGDGLRNVVLAEARSIGVEITPGAVELLIAKIGNNSRLLAEEVQKLSAYIEKDPAAEKLSIEEADVAELSPNVAEGDFFEAAEAFFSGDLKWTLAALHRHFFVGGDSRPILSTLQNRNRILIQVRSLVDAGMVRPGPRGLSGLPNAQKQFESFFTGAAEKSSYNLFSQNAWYVGKLAGAGKLPSLRRLIDNQQAFIRAFEGIIERPNEQESVLREMVTSCLAS